MAAQQEISVRLTVDASPAVEQLERAGLALIAAADALRASQVERDAVADEVTP